MTTLLYIWLALSAYVAWLVLTAPFGWQDHNGYHDGKQEQNDGHD